jgi:WD40 repeat protein
MSCTSGIFSLDISMSDSIVASGHRDGALRFWNIKDSKLVHEIKNVHDDLVSSISYMPNDGN